MNPSWLLIVVLLGVHGISERHTLIFLDRASCISAIQTVAALETIYANAKPILEVRCERR